MDLSKVLNQQKVGFNNQLYDRVYDLLYNSLDDKATQATPILVYAIEPDSEKGYKIAFDNMYELGLKGDFESSPRIFTNGEYGVILDVHKAVLFNRRGVIASLEHYQVALRKIYLDTLKTRRSRLYGYEWRIMNMFGIKEVI